MENNTDITKKLKGTYSGIIPETELENKEFLEAVESSPTCMAGISFLYELNVFEQKMCQGINHICENFKKGYRK